MATGLLALVTQRKSGSERFYYDGRDAGFDLLSFWQWSASDLVSNATRGVLAEYIVSQALGVANGIWNEWDAFDIRTKTDVKVEVKSAAYVQTWYQRRLSQIVFTVGPRRGFDPKTNVLDDQPKWQAEVYVFALLAVQEKKAVDPLKLEQWAFYVLPVSVLEKRKRSQHSITLKSLQSLCPLPVRFAELADAIHRAGERSKHNSTMAAATS